MAAVGPRYYGWRRDHPAGSLGLYIGGSRLVTYISPADSSYLQEIVDTTSAAGGGTIEAAPGEYGEQAIVLKEGVRIVGPGGLHLDSSIPSTDNSRGARFQSISGSYIFDTPATQIEACEVSGLHLYGQNSDSADDGGIRFQNVQYGAANNNTIRRFANEAIVLVEGLANRFEDNRATRCLLNRTRAAKIGVIDIGGTDNWVIRGEYSASSDALSSEDMNIAAVASRGNHNMFEFIVSENADINYWTDGNPNLSSFLGCRADLAFGHGWWIDGLGSRFTGCEAYNVSRETANTYSGFYVTASAVRNLFTGCKVHKTTEANAHKYGFEDLVASGERSVYVGCRSIGHGTNEFIKDGVAGAVSTATTVFT